MDELRGDQAVWGVDGSSVAIRYHSGWFKDPLLKRLDRCEVPVAAVASVDFRAGAGRKRGWVLRLRLRERTDPYSAVGALLAEDSQPFRLTGPASTELLAEYYADQIAFAAGQAAQHDAGGDALRDVATRLVPRLPLHVQTREGSVAFDGSTVRLVWSGSLASSRKRKQQRREFALAEVAGAEWVPVHGSEYGYLRVVPRRAALRAALPKHDLSCLLSGEGEEGAATLLMAATITAHVWAADVAAPGPVVSGAATALEAVAKGWRGVKSEWVHARIERLDRLRAEGVITDEEFAARKAELLGRL